MKNKIIGLFMLAAMSTISMGGCPDEASKTNTDEKLNKHKGFTSIEIKSNSPLEAEVTLKFEQGTKLDGYFIKFEGSAVVQGTTKANGKDSNEPVKLSDLGTTSNDQLLFKVTRLKGDEKITVSLVDSQGKVVKDKDGKEIKSETTIKPADPKPTAEFKEVKGKGAGVSLTIEFKKLTKDEDIKNYYFETNFPVYLGIPNYPYKGLTQIKNFDLALEGIGFEWHKDKKELTVTLLPGTKGCVTYHLKSKDDTKFAVVGEANIKFMICHQK